MADSSLAPDLRPRLLIVDDEPRNLRLLADIFAADYQLSLATSGAQALQLLEVTPQIELVLLDLMMPEMDGLQVLERLRRNPAWQDLPIIFVTARRDVDSEIAAIDSGVADYLHKPVHVGLARARVRQQLTLARQRRELDAARAAADAGSRAKSRFLTSMSHDLRTPLNAILGFSQMLGLDENLSPMQRASVGEIRDAGQHLLALINDVLDLGKIEASRLDLFPDVIELEPLAQSCLRLIESQALARRVTVVLEAPKQPLHAYADATRVRQVLVNLLTNAVKYHRELGHVVVRLHDGGSEGVRLEVQDDGPGIAPSQVPMLFEPFHRGGASQLRHVEGTGIGLTICKRLVEFMGGQIGVDSRLGEGSCFWFTLPTAAGRAARSRLESGVAPPSPERQVQPQPDGGPGQQSSATSMRTVLCIDDNPSNLRLLEIVLRRLPQLRVVADPDPTRAIVLAAQHRPDLILLDIQMPVIDGYEVLRRLRAVPALKAIPVAALSANAMEEDLQAGLAAGFVDYFTKPFDVPTLLKAVERLMPAPVDPPALPH